MFFRKKKENKETAAKKTVFIPEDIDQFYGAISYLTEVSKIKIDDFQNLIITLEKKVMDHNDENPEDEEKRKQMRPLTNELMNEIKINRNLISGLLHEIKLIDFNQISERFITRFYKAKDEILNSDTAITDLVDRFNSEYKDILLIEVSGLKDNINNLTIKT